MDLYLSIAIDGAAVVAGLVAIDGAVVDGQLSAGIYGTALTACRIAGKPAAVNRRADVGINTAAVSC